MTFDPSVMENPDVQFVLIAGFGCLVALILIGFILGGIVIAFGNRIRRKNDDWGFPETRRRS